MDNRPTVLTGLRTNALYHLGNYFGAIKPIVDMQKRLGDKYNFFVFIPDLHSFTTPTDHSSLYAQTIQNIKLLIASGLNLSLDNTIIYRQSFIPAHSELTVILNNFTYMGELKRMTQFKDKSQNSDSVTVGLFDYPVLMASDILLYDAKYVPVGEDQRQHLELTRDIAVRMNNKFGELFVVPEDWESQVNFRGLQTGLRIRSLSKPEKKMSKSDEDQSGTIMLTDNIEQATKKVLSATTDSLSEINYDFDSQPGISNLLELLALLDDVDINKVVSDWSKRKTYKELKEIVAKKVGDFLEKIQSQLDTISDNEVLDHLAKGEEIARQISSDKLLSVQRAVGLRQ